MIRLLETMTEFYRYFQLAKQGQVSSVFDIIMLLEVMDLRLRRLESEAGIPMPDDIIRVREVEGRK